MKAYRKYAQVAAPFVSSRRLPGNLGYVQLRGFPEASVVTQVEQAILQQQREGVRGIVFDLRGNGGGRTDRRSREACGYHAFAALLAHPQIRQCRRRRFLGLSR